MWFSPNKCAESNYLRVCNHSPSSRPKKRLVDVYRSVFFIRREVFNNRPVADSKGEVSSADREQFQSSCNMICINLMFITCLVDAAMPEESGQLVACRTYMYMYLPTCTLYMYLPHVHCTCTYLPTFGY